MRRPIGAPHDTTTVLPSTSVKERRGANWVSIRSGDCKRVHNHS